MSAQSERETRYSRVLLVSSGHMTNDLYGNLLSSLTPYLILTHALGTAMAGVVLLVYLAASSVLQPIFGLLSDRSGRRFFAVAGPLWTGVAAVAFPLAHGTLLLLAIAGIGGIGSAAFHPQAASIVDSLGRRNKGWIMSLFSMGGNLGFAVGPLVAATLFSVGFGWSPFAIIPGLLYSLIAFLYIPAPPVAAGVQAEPLSRTLKRTWKPLSLIVLVIAIRSGAQLGMIIFLPLFYHAHGLPAQLGSLYATVLALAGAVGGLAGGSLSDRFGRNPVVTVSLFLAAPLLLLVSIIPGPVAAPIVFLAGASLSASSSVVVVQAQSLLPANTGIASGLTLGLGFGLSGIFTTILTSIAGHIGVLDAILFIPAMPLIGGIVSLAVPAVTRGRASHMPAPTAAG